MKRTIVIGAGPAGLAAADKLLEHNIETVILEKSFHVGGLSRTIVYNGYNFDIGPHRFFTKNKTVFNWWKKTLGRDFAKKPRSTRIYYKGKFFDYPLSVGNVLFTLGIFSSLAILFSYLKSRLIPSRDEDSFEGWVANRFGFRLYEIFFKEYTEKIWGIPCSRLSSEWASQRIKGLSFSSALRNAIFKGRNNIKTLTKEFYYPRLGAGMMYRAVASRILEKGGQIKLNSEVIKVKRDHKRITSLVCKDAHSGNLFEVEGEHFCSSMPLNLLVLAMEPPVDKQVLEIARKLHYRSLLMVYLIIGKKEVFRDNWIYVHSKDVMVGRIQNYKNWSPDMVGDFNKTSLGLEYFCTEGDKVWSQSNAEAIGLAGEELEKLKLANGNDILDAFLLHVPCAYPVYEKGYQEAVSAIKDYLDGFFNLQCIGRYGMFRYNNMDHSILTGFLAAENILGARHDLWNVNVEQSYHEELEEE